MNSQLRDRFVTNYEARNYIVPIHTDGEPIFFDVIVRERSQSEEVTLFNGTGNDFSGVRISTNTVATSSSSSTTTTVQAPGTSGEVVIRSKTTFDPGSDFGVEGGFQTPWASGRAQWVTSIEPTTSTTETTIMWNTSDASQKEPLTGRNTTVDAAGGIPRKDPFEVDFQFYDAIILDGVNVIDQVLAIAERNIEESFQTERGDWFHFLDDDPVTLAVFDRNGKPIEDYFGTDAFIFEQGGVRSFGTAIYNDPFITGRQFSADDFVDLTFGPDVASPSDGVVEIITHGGLVTEALGSEEWVFPSLRISDNRADGIIAGGEARDKIFGNAGNEFLDGGNDGDLLSGGIGNDTAVYQFSDSAVSIDLARNRVEGGFAEGDVLLDIESLIGSAFDDVLIGTFEANDLFGSLGGDTLRGRGGRDRLDGGSDGDFLVGGRGNDTAVYTFSEDAVFVNLADNKASGGFAEGDILISIESVVGSEFGDIIVGDTAFNDLNGSTGNDTLRGGAGGDRLQGGSGDDDLFGGFARDRLRGGIGDDLLSGGAGEDDLRGGDGHDTFVFTKRGGLDRLWDFEVDDDIIDVAGCGVTQFSELDLKDTVEGCFITCDDELILFLSNVFKEDLRSDNFFFGDV